MNESDFKFSFSSQIMVTYTCMYVCMYVCINSASYGTLLNSFVYAFKELKNFFYLKYNQF